MKALYFQSNYYNFYAHKDQGGGGGGRAGAGGLTGLLVRHCCSLSVYSLHKNTILIGSSHCKFVHVQV